MAAIQAISGNQQPPNPHAGLARAAGKGTVGTVGGIEVHPSLINAVPESIRFSLDIRGIDDDAYRGVARGIGAFAERAAARRGLRASGARAPRGGGSTRTWRHRWPRPR